jgi:VCBS repeat-containing protein
MQNLAITVHGGNDAPTVTANASARADLGTTREDTSITFNEAQLLHAVGAADVDNANALHVSAITVDPTVGTLTRQADGSWRFTPTHDLSRDDVPFTITVTDGHAQTTAHATLDITAVADAPISSMAESVTTDFATPVITGNGGQWQRTDPTVWGWHTDNPDGMVEHGVGSAYGDTSGGNRGVVELEGFAGEASNLYRDINTRAPGTASVSI